ncbi:transporter substrate-binding domain-containing protein [Terrilactibacillus laevilacticus]|uniref:Transporter substrate-binding domain-containing protein n=1 Tax=Terrilactibacillus laevilacticus TaxID=1380157 RepID=A0ABW5PU77_9BACI|nr:transporter substrate-binding domain-containing protein [Terrilactibacillus laevilacticus]
MFLLKKLILICTALMLVLLSACGSSSDGDSKKKTLTMATSADYPPFEFVDSKSSNNSISGFDIDVAKYISKQLGYDLKIKDMEFSGLIAALNSKRADFVIAGMLPTPERKKSVDFSDGYHQIKQVVVTSKDKNIKTIEDLKGKKVGLQLGSTQEKLAESVNKQKKLGMKFEKLNKLNELVEELKTGRLDAVFSVDTVALGYLKQNKNLTSFYVPDQPDYPTAIAFPKDSKIREDFNKEIKKMKENGKMDELVKKWFSK